MIKTESVVDFIKRKIPAYEKFTDDEILSIIAKHVEFGTYDEMRDGDKLIALTRYNIDGAIGECIDLIVEDGYDVLYIMRRFAIRALEKFPYIKYLKFSRSYKYPLRRSKFWDIKRLLNIKE